MILSIDRAPFGRDKILFTILALTGLVGAVIAFPLSYVSHSQVLMGLALFPFALFVQGNQRVNYFYLVLFAVTLTIAFTFSIRIFYFLTLAFYVLWLYELFFGSVNVLILFLLVLMSPVFLQVNTIVGFPLRLQLSELSGWILQGLGRNVTVEGNVMILDGNTFSVDEACMGLNMLMMSMLMAVFIISHHYRSTGKRFNLIHLGLFFSLAFLLNMITNLTRILILVMFRIGPENPMHELIGLICLVCYVIVPLYVISGAFIKKYGHDVKLIRQSETSFRPVFIKVLLVVLPIIMILTSLHINEKRSSMTESNYAVVKYNGALGENINDGISKIVSNDLLIYVKPIADFYTSEHTPLLCWAGSGYEFKGHKQTTLEGISIYTGKLRKDDGELHTAWWYTNGKVITISQLDWRMRMLKGEEGFCLVNVTGSNEQHLLENVRAILKSNSLHIEKITPPENLSYGN